MRLTEIPQLIRLKLGPVILILFSVIMIIWLLFSKLINNKYCSEDKDLYMYSFEQSIRNKPISTIDTYSYYSIKYTFNKRSKYYIISCSNSSIKPLDKVTFKDVSEGDMINKDANSNEFTIIKDGKEYIFEIDPNRKKDGSYKEHITLLDKIKKMFD